MRRIYRLPRGKDLERLLRSGRRISSPLFQLIFRKNNIPHARFAFIISRRVVKSAVIRNRLRRRLQEFVRKDKSLLSSAHDVAIICGGGAREANRRQLYELLSRLLAEFRKNHP